MSCIPRCLARVRVGAWLAALLLLTLLMAACGPLAPEPTPTTPPTATPTPEATAPPTVEPEPTATPTETPELVVEETATPTPTPQPEFRPQVEVVATNLEIPWAMAFAPDGRLFFTERPGRVRVMVDGAVLSEPVATPAVLHIGEGGLLGLALDPDFVENGYLYIYYTYQGADGQPWNRVSRLTERDNRADEEQVILDDIPGHRIHNGGRIRFGPDGKLYITTGDAAVVELSQQLDSLAGKFLRINKDGSVPEDNPFPDSPVWSYGHRNPQGIDWDPITGNLVSTEHGPVGDDEVNIIRPGENYGWPVVSGIAGHPDFVDPIIDYSPAVAPSGANSYTGDALWEWEGDYFFATLRGNHLHRLRLGGENRDEVVESERLYDGAYGRLRDVLVGPDGYLYVCTSNRDGRGAPVAEDDRILRIMPGP